MRMQGKAGKPVTWLATSLWSP